MKRLLLATILIICTFQVNSQESKWSMLPENAKKKAEKTVSNFVDAINKNQDISKYFTSKEANYGGQIWMPLNEYAKFIKSILPKQIDSLKLIYYNFDDVESDELIKAKALELNRVFNNFSIIASGKFNSQNITLVLQPVNSDIKIYSITVESVALKMASKEIDAFHYCPVKIGSLIYNKLVINTLQRLNF